MLFDDSICYLQVLLTRSKSLLPPLQQNSLLNADCALNGEEGVNTSAFDRFADTDNVLRYARYLIFSAIVL